MSRKQAGNRKGSKQKAVVTGQERIARLIALSLVMASFVSIVFWQFQQWLMDPETLPVQIVKIDGGLKQLKKVELEKAVAGVVSGGYFNIDLNAVQNAAHKLAWVEDVSVKRRWPDTLVMTIKEKTALAQWGKGKLVTAGGVVFAPENDLPAGLPVLIADDSRAQTVVEVYQREVKRFEKLDLVIKQLVLNERGAWSISFANGLQVAVGRVDVEQRLQRLTRYLQVVKKYKGMPETIDLRYSHGMAVNFGEQDEAETAQMQADKEAV